jgi:phage regulator Rha-like protein
MANIVSVELIATKILFLRGKRAMLDADLASLYGVSTKRLNEQVKRNQQRFPEDFMFRLTKAELDSLRSHFATLKKGSKRGKHVKYLPYVFTQEGVAMLSSVLNSERAIQVNIAIMRAFVQLRRMVLSNKDLRRKIEEMERKYDKQFAIVFQAIKQLLEPEKKPKPRIGFHS